MEVEAGFKQTDVGIIPNDWNVTPLGQQLRRIPTYGINAPAIPFDFRFPTYLRITDITDDGRFDEASKASVSHSASASYLLEPGDLVFARTGASVGKSYLYNQSDGELVFAGFLIRVSPDTKRLVPEFLKFYIQSKTYWNWIKTNSMRSGQPGINGREYASLPIPLPPTLAEQEAIAEALSDADALIEALEQLLAKKRQVKQGAMQELLTGKKRLPGFEKKSGYIQTEVGVIPEDWQVVTLAKVCRMKSGESITGDNIDQFSEYPCYGGNGLRGFTNRFTHDGKYALIGRQGALCGNVLGVSGKFFASEHAVVVTALQQTDIQWLTYVLEDMNLNQYSESSAQPGLSVSKILDLPLAIPPTKNEQTAIAEILSDTDTEIAALEEKLVKARQVKQGMMSVLLTGRIRLVDHSGK